MLKNSWWVLIFCIGICLLHLHFFKEKKKAFVYLSHRLEEMEKERSLALEKKDDLQLRLASQNDPAWIEMILMRDLGVVPEGFLKVHFKNQHFNSVNSL